MSAAKARVLCVDDGSLNLSLLEAMLLPRGYDVILASNGMQALEKIQMERIDICLLDVMMPGMDGFEVCCRIKADPLHSNIPVIMITAHADMENRIRGTEAGAEDFITKPFASAEVLARIAMLLRVKVLNDQLTAAYHNIDRISAFGEQVINTFDPMSFHFLDRLDSVVRQLVQQSTTNLIDLPQIVLIGMLNPSGELEWLSYISKDQIVARNTVEIEVDQKYVFSAGAASEVVFYPNDDAQLSTSLLVAALRAIPLPVHNLVKYANENFCLIALNYGHTLTSYDAGMIKTVMMQILFLRSLAAQTQDTESAFDYTVLALARASEANDEDTGDHILRVGEYSALIARELGLADKMVNAIRIQSALHDVGKIHVPAAILKKSGPLSEEEWHEMKLHTQYGSKIIGEHPRMSFADAIANSHHERYDGSGYPKGLAGEQIPLEARIVALADQYDALRNARCYKPALDHETTCKIILEGDGRTLPQHFDPHVLNIFKEHHEQFAAIYESLPHHQRYEPQHAAMQ